MKDLISSPKTIKLGKENKGLNFHDLGLGSGFFNVIPKTKATKEKVNKLDFIKI